MPLFRAEAAGQPQRARPGHNHAHAVARRIGGRHHRLHRRIARRAFDAVGINHHVLRGRRKAEQHRSCRHPRQHRLISRIERGHRQNRGDNQPLHQQQPAAPLPETAREPRQRKRID